MDQETFNVLMDNYKQSKKTEKKQKEFSKVLLIQESVLIWILSIAFIILAFYCVHNGFLGSLPWLSAMVALPWTAYGVTRSFHLNKSKAENTSNGITFETAMKELEMQRDLYLKTKDEEAVG